MGLTSQLVDTTNITGRGTTVSHLTDEICGRTNETVPALWILGNTVLDLGKTVLDTKNHCNLGNIYFPLETNNLVIPG